MLEVDLLSLQHACACAKLHKMCFEQEWQEEDFQLLLSNIHVRGFGVWDAKELVAVLLVQDAGVSADIITLMVHPAYLRRGLGRRLVTEFLEVFFKAGGESCFLEVSCENEVAILFYKTLSFIVCGLRKNYYNVSGRQIDALILQALSSKN